MSAPKLPSGPTSNELPTSVKKKVHSTSAGLPTAPDQTTKPIKKKIPKIKQADDVASKADSAVKSTSSQAQQKLPKQGVPKTPDTNQSSRTHSVSETVTMPDPKLADPTAAGAVTKKVIKKKSHLPTAQPDDVNTPEKLDSPAPNIGDHVVSKKKPRLPTTTSTDQLPSGDKLEQADQVQGKVKRSAEKLKPSSDSQAPDLEKSGQVVDQVKEGAEKQKPKFKPSVPQGDGGPTRQIKKKIKKLAPPVEPEPELEPEPEELEPPQPEPEELEPPQPEHEEEEEEKEIEIEHDDEHSGGVMHDIEEEEEEEETDKGEEEEEEVSQGDEVEDEEADHNGIDVEEEEGEEEGEEAEEEEDEDEEDGEGNIVAPLDATQKDESPAQEVSAKGEDVLSKGKKITQGSKSAAEEVSEKSQTAAKHATEMAKDLIGNESGTDAFGQKQPVKKVADKAKDTKEKTSKSISDAVSGIKDDAGGLDNSATGAADDVTQAAGDTKNQLNGATSGAPGSDALSGVTENTRDAGKEATGFVPHIVEETGSIFSEDATKTSGDASPEVSGLGNLGQEAGEKAGDLKGKTNGALSQAKDQAGSLTENAKGIGGEDKDIGTVADQAGESLGKTTSDISSMAGKKVDTAGEIVDTGKIGGKGSQVAEQEGHDATAMIKGFAPETGGSGSVTANGIQISVQSTKDGISLTINIPGSFQHQ